jgi:hypothetical protein
MFCAPRLVFSGTEGVGSRFYVLCSVTRFRRCRVRRVPFSCFAVPGETGPFFLFCDPGLVFGGTEVGGSRFHVFIFGSTEVVGSHFHVLRSRNHFRRYRGRRDPFSCFVLTDSFWVPRASDPVFTFCARGIIFGGIGGVQSYFHILRARTHIRRYRGRRVSFSCFDLLDSFSLVPKASGPVFMFCAPGLVFGGTEGVRSLFYVLCSGTRFRRCRVRRVPFSCFVLPKSFSAVSVWGPVFMFCAPGFVFGGTEGVGSHFHVLRSRNRFRRCRVCWVPIFMFCAPGFIFVGNEGVGSRFLVLRARTNFRW